MKNKKEAFTTDSTIKYTGGAPVSLYVDGMPISFTSASSSTNHAESTYNYRGNPAITTVDRSKLSSTTNYDILIKQLDLGCIVTIGDKQIALSSTEEGVELINNLLSDREETIKNLNESF